MNCGHQHDRVVDDDTGHADKADNREKRHGQPEYAVSPNRADQAEGNDCQNNKRLGPAAENPAKDQIYREYANHEPDHRLIQEILCLQGKPAQFPIQIMTARDSRQNVGPKRQANLGGTGSVVFGEGAADIDQAQAVFTLDSGKGGAGRDPRDLAQRHIFARWRTQQRARQEIARQFCLWQAHGDLCRTYTSGELGSRDAVQSVEQLGADGGGRKAQRLSQRGELQHHVVLAVGQAVLQPR